MTWSHYDYFQRPNNNINCGENNKHEIMHFVKLNMLHYYIVHEVCVSVGNITVNKIAWSNN